jgi:hypothetical protein
MLVLLRVFDSVLQTPRCSSYLIFEEYGIMCLECYSVITLCLNYVNSLTVTAPTLGQCELLRRQIVVRIYTFYMVTKF